MRHIDSCMVLTVYINMIYVLFFVVSEYPK
jgi:hypothetical protein